MTNPLQFLPSVHAVAEHSEIQPLVDEWGRPLVMVWIREALDVVRTQCVRDEGTPDRPQLLDDVLSHVMRSVEYYEARQLGRVINATGIVLHTGLGRALLSDAAREALLDAAGATNVELDLESGQRRHRGYQLQTAWQMLTGCEDVLVVNNNAAATLLTLQALCADREVVLSRGQLIEIGGAFRLPDIFRLSGARLCEVGTTNRTRLQDYAEAMVPETAALMKVHPSNFRIVGFTHSPTTRELAELAHSHQRIMIDDIGSGSLVELDRWGMPGEPTFQASLRDGADLVLGSGDKLLGGPQCGIILGRADLIEQLRKHPLARAMRVDKLTLASLAATLDAYLRDRHLEELPTLQLLTATVDSLRQRAQSIVGDLGPLEQLQCGIEAAEAAVGGGALPGILLPTIVISVAHPRLSATTLARELRGSKIRIVPRIRERQVLLDLRSILPADDSRVTLALRLLDRHLQ